MGMRALMIGFALVLAVPLVGCAGGSEEQAPARTVVSIAADGQTQRINVEVARSEEAQQKGLLFSTEMAKDGRRHFTIAKHKDRTTAVKGKRASGRLEHGGGDTKK